MYNVARETTSQRRLVNAIAQNKPVRDYIGAPQSVLKQISSGVEFTSGKYSSNPISKIKSWIKQFNDNLKSPVAFTERTHVIHEFKPNKLK